MDADKIVNRRNFLFGAGAALVGTSCDSQTQSKTKTPDFAQIITLFSKLNVSQKDYIISEVLKDRNIAQKLELLFGESLAEQAPEKLLEHVYSKSSIDAQTQIANSIFDKLSQDTKIQVLGKTMSNLNTDQKIKLGVPLKEKDLYAEIESARTENRPVNLSGAVFDEPVDLTLKDLKGSNFSNVIFHKKVEISGADLSDSNFEGAVFGQGLSTDGPDEFVIFGDEAKHTTFQNTTSLKNANFKDCKFEGDFKLSGKGLKLSGTNFEGTQFKNRVNIIDFSASSKSKSLKSNFDNLSFENASFLGNSDFTLRADSIEGLNLNSTKIWGDFELSTTGSTSLKMIKADFGPSPLTRFSLSGPIVNSQIADVDLSKKEFGHATFGGTFSNSELKNVNFGKILNKRLFEEISNSNVHATIDSSSYRNWRSTKFKGPSQINIKINDPKGELKRNPFGQEFPYVKNSTDGETRFSISRVQD